MRIRLLAAAFSGAALLTGAGLVQGAEGPTCGSFTLTGGTKVVKVVDNPPKDESPGDTRTGSRELLDANGKKVGDVYFVATLTATADEDSGNVFGAQYFAAFPNGTVISHSLYELPDAQDTSQKASDAILVVSGGTRAFENATGKITIEAGNPPTYVFDLKCD
jgi:hypothetical protein